MATTLRLATTVLLSLALLACGGDDGKKRRIRLATTTSTDNSGLLAAILPAFEQEYGAGVDVVAVGTGQALALGERGECDMVLVHARVREDEFIAAGHGTDRRDIMWNDFLIAGPPEDPAGVSGMKDAAAALQKIAATGARFVSRGDDSGTHIREGDLWASGGGLPEWKGYLLAGQGMGPCLTIADEKNTYVLTDRGTYLAYRGRLDLDVLVEGDPALRNPYGAMLVNAERHSHVNAEGARALLEYLVSPAGRKAIGEFRVNGETLFRPHGSD